MLFLENKMKYIIRGILVFFLFWYSAYLQLIPIYLFHLNPHKISNSTQVLLSTFSSLVICIILFFIYRKELKNEFLIFKKNIMENMDVAFRYWIIGLIIMMLSNFILTFFFKSGGANNEKIVQKLISSLPWLMAIDAGVIAPFNEEIVFRKTLKDIFDNKYIFLFLSVLLFGGAHVFSSAETVLDYLYIIPYGALGGAFACTYYKTNTIFPSMFMHMIHNTVLVLLSIIAL